jgi:ferredoxin-NADP reductase
MGWWVYAGLVVWGADRFVGFARLIIFNLRFVVPFSSQKGNCTVELVDSKVVRLTFNRPSFQWSTGQHAFISIPSVATLRYEQHPFTILNVPDEDGKVVFLIRAQQGFTRRLVERIDTIAKSDLELGSFIEGPYGIGHDFNHFDTVVLVAGGTGITFGFGHLLAIIRAAREGKSAVSHVRLVWNVRHGMHLAWIAPLLNSALERGCGNLRVTIDAYITQSVASAEPATDGNGDSADPESPVADTPCDSEFVSPRTSGEYAYDSKPAASRDSQLSDSEKLALAAGLNKESAAVTVFHHGRSHLEGILRLDVEGSTNDAGGVAMGVCGPTALALDARRSVQRVNSSIKVLRGQTPVELHTETFGW